MKWSKVAKTDDGPIWRLKDDHFFVEVTPENNWWGITLSSPEDEDKVEIRKIDSAGIAKCLAETLVVALRWGHQP